MLIKTLQWETQAVFVLDKNRLGHVEYIKETAELTIRSRRLPESCWQAVYGQYVDIIQQWYTGASGVT